MQVEPKRSQPGEAIRFYRYFASYSSDDRELVVQAAGLLRSTGADLFIDYVSLRGGDEWETKIRDGIRGADKFYLFWSARSSSSAWVAKEIEIAREFARQSYKADFIVPVPLDSTALPGELEGYHCIPLDLIPDKSSLGFSTEKLKTSDDGFEIQFSLTNSNRSGELNIYDVIPVVIYRHYKVVYEMKTPHRLAPTTLSSLRQLSRRRDHRLLESGSIFVGMSVTENRNYRLRPGEIDTFQASWS